MTAKLMVTKDYDLFEMNDLNRGIEEKPGLLDSMARHGFMPSSPIQVTTVNGRRDRFKIIRGHHRYHYAKRLGIPLYFVVDDSNTDLHSLERDSSQSWSVTDFAESHERAGDPAYVTLMDFKRKHHLTMGAAASLVGGEGASSHNKLGAIRRGTFKCGDMAHARAVVAITDYCRELGVPFATNSAFVGAVSAVLRVKEFDASVFKHRLSLHAAMLNKRSRQDEYLEEIEALYNYQARGNRIPLKFLAIQAANERSPIRSHHRISK